MNSQSEKIMVNDCNTIANGIMQEINEVNNFEKIFTLELSSEDLFQIDSAILSSLRKTNDFSKDLLAQLEAGNFEEFMEKPVDLFESDLMQIQQDALQDITLPLQKMFDDMTNLVTDALVEI